MTREEFIKILEEKGYSYEIEGDKIVVTHRGSVNLISLETLPPDVVFKNEGIVFLRSLQTISPGVEFKNGSDVNLNSLKTIYPGVVFKNGGSVYFEILETIYPGVVFNNGRIVNLESLVGGRFDNWSGNIEGIDSNRLLNLMIKRGIFK